MSDLRIPIKVTDFVRLVGSDQGFFVLKLDIAASKPIPPQRARGTDQLIDLDIDTAGILRLGGQKVSLDAEARGYVDIVWPENDDRDVILNLELPEDPETLYLVLKLEGRAKIGGQHKFPIGPLSATIGVTSEGSATYSYLRPFNRNMRAGQVFQTFLESPKLPFDAVESVGRLVQNEVTSVSLNGYLKVNAGASWGYSVRKYDAGNLGDLDLSASVDVGASVGMRAAYSVGGAFTIDAIGTAEPEWIRIRIRKARSSEGALAFDIKAVVDFDSDGLPESPYSFFDAILDLSTPSFLGEVSQLLRESDGDPDVLIRKLSTKTLAITRRPVENFLARVLGDSWQSEAKDRLVSTLEAVRDAYYGIAASDKRLLLLLEEYAENPDGLEALLDQVLGLPGRGELTEVQSAELWRALRLYLREEVFEFLTSDQTFNTVRATLEQLKSSALKEVSTLVASRKGLASFGVLLEELKPTVERIEGVDDIDRVSEVLKAELGEHVVQFVNRLLGKKKKDLLHLVGVVKSIESTAQRFYEGLRSALNESHRFEISASYARASEHQALIDVEINLSTANGIRLARQVVSGDLSRVFDATNSKLVRLHAGLLTHRLENAKILSLDVFGFTYEQFRRLVMQTDQVLVPTERGVIVDTTISGLEEKDVRRRREQREMDLLFTLSATGPTPELVDSIRSIAFDYSLTLKDEDASPAEVRQYLEFGRSLQLVRTWDLDGFVEHLRLELGLNSGDSFGRTSLVYRVRVSPELFHTLFVSETGGFDSIVRTILRDFASMHFLAQALRHKVAGRHVRYDQYKMISDLVRREEVFRARHQINPDTTSGEGDLVIGSDRFTLNEFDRIRLWNAFFVEEQYARAFRRLDEVIDATTEFGSVRTKKVREAFRDFIAMRNKLEKAFDSDYVDPFFVLLDRLSSVYKIRRQSTLELSLQNKNRETVTKIFVSS